VEPQRPGIAFPDLHMDVARIFPRGVCNLPTPKQRNKQFSAKTLKAKYQFYTSREPFFPFDAHHTSATQTYRMTR